MRDITKLMIVKYNLLELKYDFMGYPFDKEKELSFHHLIIPRRLCAHNKIENDGYVEWNGVILRQNTAHDYIHIIERYDREMFDAVTNYMIEENKQGYINDKYLLAINDVLNEFEKEYSDIKTKNGKCLIRKKYKERITK